jgi:hypothetical protein
MQSKPATKAHKPADEGVYNRAEIVCWHKIHAASAQKHL